MGEIKDLTTEYEKVSFAIDSVIAYAKKYLRLDRRDEAYARNRVIDIVKLPVYAPSFEEPRLFCDRVVVTRDSLESLWYVVPDAMLENLTNALKDAELIDEDTDLEELYDRIMDAVSLPPSEVDRRYQEFKESDNQYAMDWLYNYSVANGYVKLKKLEANPFIRSEIEQLDACINLSRPEIIVPKRKVENVATSVAPAIPYPKCALCPENVGYGNKNKRTLRIAELELGGEKYFWQYSPYGYFKKHGVAISANHEPMYINRQTFIKLCDFAKQFFGFFIGSNAALPGVGGSVPAHDHYQGGDVVLPVVAAPIRKIFLRHDIRLDILDWHCTTIRMACDNPVLLAEACEEIRLLWQNYTDESRNLIPKDKNGLHHAISPTVTKCNDTYVMTIIFRSNYANEQHPNGVFNTPEEYTAIKKEALGLMETQGFFVLPGRLKGEIEKVRAVIANGDELPSDMNGMRAYYNDCLRFLPEDRERVDDAMLDRAMNEGLARSCCNILKSASVMNIDETATFVEKLGYKFCREIVDEEEP